MGEAGLPKKLPCVVYGTVKGENGKHVELARFVVTGFSGHDDALARARGGAEARGFAPMSANFSPTLEGGVAGVKVYARETRAK
jgi:hypothetical protein